ncbi:hypothetical protein Acr_00g0061100 [Actinidia rufa]|uniref:H15 domain-containing protein n=1 Tax=Actinidia rufa TaxID=165716 RepID=A0A7J0DNL9_9ERIC|nr:hypothetical protein Acr_00g0061100 [Actinidia rufa]
MDPKPEAAAPPLPELEMHHHHPAAANFRSFVTEMAVALASKPLTPAHKSLVQKRLIHFFPDARTPRHPVYAAMIHRAIIELNEQGGSREESISTFIQNEYHDLPRAHSSFLKHHLWKLCESGEITMTRDKSYLLGKREELKIKRKKLGRPRKIKEEQMESIDVDIRVTQVQNTVVEEQNQLTEKWDEVFAEIQDEVIVEHDQVEEQNEANRETNQAELQNESLENELQEQENQASGEMNTPQKQEAGVRQEQNQPEEGKNDAAKGQALSEEQQIEAIEEKNQSLVQQSVVLSEQDQHQEQEIIVALGQKQQADQQNRIMEKQSQRVHPKRLRSDSQAEKDKPKKRIKKSLVTCIIPDLPPDMPLKFRERIEGFNASEVVFVIQKRLYKTDVSEGHNRLFMPFSQIKTEFLRPEEKTILENRNGKKIPEIEVLLIEPSCEHDWTMSLKILEMRKASGQLSYVYNLGTNWNKVVSNNSLCKGMIVQLWAFRVDSKLCFVLVKVVTGDEDDAIADQSTSASRKRRKKLGRPHKIDLMKEENRPKEEKKIIDMEIQVTEEQNKVTEEQNMQTEIGTMYENNGRSNSRASGQGSHHR